MKKSLRILGTRGIPAQHGGFETFAQQLALYLVNRDWEVTVYCQRTGSGYSYEDSWNDIKLIHIPIKQTGAKGTIIFDWKSTLHASHYNDLILTLGYNTAIFCVLYRLKGITNLINMDGIEWRRDKWSFLERGWLLLNEFAGCWLGNHLIADHPEIKNHLTSRTRGDKITMIPYGSENITNADESILQTYSLEPNKYVIVIARPEPENSIFEIVSAFSSRQRDMKLVVLGNFEQADPIYREKVFSAASDEVVFPGAIYDKTTVEALRFYSFLYIHGHTVGGTNPSLVEALGAASAILAHDNIFNRWVIGDGGQFFSDTQECGNQLEVLLSDQQLNLTMKLDSLKRFTSQFTLDRILSDYESLLLDAINKHQER